MQYPLYVVRENGRDTSRDGATAFRAVFPDFPGAGAAGSSFEELERNAKQAVERIYAHSNELIPAPTGDAQLRAFEARGDDGLWVYVDIDLTRMTSSAVGIKLSVPEALLKDVDAAAHERSMTRAAFMTLAAVHELERQSNWQVPNAAPVASRSGLAS